MKSYSPEEAKLIRIDCEAKLKFTDKILCPLTTIAGKCWEMSGPDCQPFFDVSLANCPCRMSENGDLDMSRAEIKSQFWKRLKEMESKR